MSQYRNPFEQVKQSRYEFFSDDKDNTLGINSIGIKENSINIGNVKNTKSVYKYYQSNGIIDAQGTMHLNVREYDKLLYKSF